MITDSPTMRYIGGMFWDQDERDDTWTASYAGRTYILIRQRRADSRVSQDGWYLHGDDGNEFGPAWAGAHIDHALQVATLLVRDEWQRTGLREPDATPTWRNKTTGEVWRQPEVLATLDGDGFTDLLAIARAEVGYDRGILQLDMSSDEMGEIRHLP